MSEAALKTASQRYTEIKSLANAIVGKLQDEMTSQGFDDSVFKLTTAENAICRLEKDTFSGEYSLAGEWLDEQQGKVGAFVFHADGSFFAECDIIRPHPDKPKWFVEAINAWGKDDSIKVELKLLPMLD